MPTNYAPKLQLHFAKTKKLDPRITFSRASTATYFDAAGVLRTAPANEPRFDHDPVTHESKGLLIEEARTNGFKYSDQLDNATVWTVGNLTVSPNASVADPRGGTAAFKLVENTVASTSHSLSQLTTISAGTQTTIWGFLHASERPAVRLQVLDGGASANAFYAQFDVSDGTVGTALAVGTGVLTSYGIVPIGGGWFIAWVTGTANTAPVGNSRGYVWIVPSKVASATYTGDGTSGVYVYAMQIEAAPSVSSYIPTGAATVTRAADVASMAGANFSSWYRQDEGTFVYEATAVQTATARAVCVASSTVSQSSPERLQLVINSANYTSDAAVNGGVTQVTGINVASQTGPNYRHAMAYRLNDYISATNGVLSPADTAGTVPAPTMLYLGSSSGGIQLNGCIARLSYFPTRLADAELQRLAA